MTHLTAHLTVPDAVSSCCEARDGEECFLQGRHHSLWQGKSSSHCSRAHALWLTRGVEDTCDAGSG